MNGSGAKVKAVRSDAVLLTVWLDDGRMVSVPLAWYPSLLAATPAERRTWRASAAGRGIHWPKLDYDLSIEGILAGRKEHPNALRYVHAARVKVQGVCRTTPRTKILRTAVTV